MNAGIARRAGSAAVILIALVLAAVGCSTAGHRAAARPPAPAASLPLATSMQAQGPTWATVVAGGPAASHDSFWQLLVQPAPGRPWQLVTPPGVASNGGLVIAPDGARSLLTGFQPSQHLTFTPLAATTDAGTTWSPGIIDADIAAEPGALAAEPGTTRLLALLATGSVRLGTRQGSWTTIGTLRSIAATPAGRRCGLASLTAVAFAVDGDPLLAGTCARAGLTGIFAFSRDTWHPAGPTLPPAVAGQQISVPAMQTWPSHSQALIQAGSGSASQLIEAWSIRGGWALSQPIALHGTHVLSVSASTVGGIGVVLSGRAGLVLAGPSASWQRLPELPRSTQTLAIGPGNLIQALTSKRSTVTIWTCDRQMDSWTRTQAVKVPIQLGSSG
jgi:hypothetical protein